MSSQNMPLFWGERREAEKEHIFHCVLKCQIIRLVKNLGRHKHLLSVSDREWCLLAHYSGKHQVPEAIPDWTCKTPVWEMLTTYQRADILIRHWNIQKKNGFFITTRENSKNLFQEQSSWVTPTQVEELESCWVDLRFFFTDLYSNTLLPVQ